MLCRKSDSLPSNIHVLFRILMKALTVNDSDIYIDTQLAYETHFKEKHFAVSWAVDLNALKVGRQRCDVKGKEKVLITQ